VSIAPSGTPLSRSRSSRLPLGRLALQGRRAERRRRLEPRPAPAARPGTWANLFIPRPPAPATGPKGGPRRSFGEPAIFLPQGLHRDSAHDRARLPITFAAEIGRVRPFPVGGRPAGTRQGREALCRRPSASNVKFRGDRFVDMVTRGEGGRLQRHRRPGDPVTLLTDKGRPESAKMALGRPSATTSSSRRKPADPLRTSAPYVVRTLGSRSRWGDPQTPGRAQGTNVAGDTGGKALAGPFLDERRGAAAGASPESGEAAATLVAAGGISQRRHGSRRPPSNGPRLAQPGANPSTAGSP